MENEGIALCIFGMADMIAGAYLLSLWMFMIGMFILACAIIKYGE